MFINWMMELLGEGLGIIFVLDLVSFEVDFDVEI